MKYITILVEPLRHKRGGYAEYRRNDGTFRHTPSKTSMWKYADVWYCECGWPLATKKVQA